MAARAKDNELERIAKRIAVACRCVIQDCLREEEWRDADHEFKIIILKGLKNLGRKLRVK